MTHHHHKHHYPERIIEHIDNAGFGRVRHFPGVNESSQAAPQIHRNGTHVTVIPARRKQRLF